jgi:hypothetical protein
VETVAEVVAEATNANGTNAKVSNSIPVPIVKYLYRYTGKYQDRVPVPY